jgi:hypothetical protein
MGVLSLHPVKGHPAINATVEIPATVRIVPSILITKQRTITTNIWQIKTDQPTPHHSQTSILSSLPLKVVGALQKSPTPAHQTTLPQGKKQCSRQYRWTIRITTIKYILANMQEAAVQTRADAPAVVLGGSLRLSSNNY